MRDFLESIDHSYLAIVGGFLINTSFLFFFNSEYRFVIYALFGIHEFIPASQGEPLSIGTTFRGTGLGLLGLFILWVSSRLDFIDKADDNFNKRFLMPWLRVMGASIFLLLCLNAFIVLSSGNSGIDSLGAFLLMIPTGLLSIPAFIPAMSYIFICTSLFLAGLLCIPRSLVFMTTRHRLRSVWSRGINSGRFDPSSVTAAMGGKSQSAAAARKLRKDAEALAQKAAKEADRLRREKDRLSQGIEDDIERLKLEAELSRRMAEIEALKIQIETLAKYKRQ